MVAVFDLARAAQLTPLLPDLSAHFRPSDSTPWTILFALTLVTLLPAILMCMTPLVRLMVVFHFLRQALGTQTAPSNPTLLGLGLMMTWFLMTPVLNQVDLVEERERQAVHQSHSQLAQKSRECQFQHRMRHSRSQGNEHITHRQSEHCFGSHWKCGRREERRKGHDSADPDQDEYHRAQESSPLWHPSQPFPRYAMYR